MGFDSRVNIVQILVDILFLGSSDSHIFADPDPDLDPDPDPDPGSQNLADPTDPDPKHCLNVRYFPKGLFPSETTQVYPSHGAWHPRLF